jgi:hypothetical protein
LPALGAEAVARPIRSWDDYAADVLLALSRAGAAPGWPLPDVMPAPAISERRPLLSCAITTYNRAPWLTHSLPLLLEATRPWRDVVEVVVCDNASTDTTPDVVARFRGEGHLSAHRNPANVGMLGNLGATARHARGAFVWLLGDDDLLVEGAIENVLEGLAAHPEVEMAYMNYAYTTFDRPERLSNPAGIVDFATPIAPGGPNRRVPALREVSPLNENLFTAIYACAFRRDHAIRGYGLDTRGAPFTSLPPACPPPSTRWRRCRTGRRGGWASRGGGEHERVLDALGAALAPGTDAGPVRRRGARGRGAGGARTLPRGPRQRGRALAARNLVRGRGRGAPQRLGGAAAGALQAPAGVPRTARGRAPRLRGGLGGRARLADDAPPAELFARYGLDG